MIPRERIVSHSSLSRRDAGFTLIEMLVSLGVVIGLLSGALSMLLSGSDAFRRVSSNTILEDQVRQSVNRIVVELRSAGSEVLEPTSAPLGTTGLTFQRPIGFDGDIVWGTPTRVAFELDPAEVDDNMDNDGDGLTDEGQVVLTRNLGLVNETRTILCRDVSELFAGELPNGDDDNGNGLDDEPGFTIQFDGPTLTIRLSIDHVDKEGRAVSRGVAKTIRLNN